MRRPLDQYAPLRSRRTRARRAAGLPLVMLMMTLCGVRTAHAQVSPGPLAAAHQDLDTPLKCFTCHGKGPDTMRERCLDCHKEIAWLVRRELGLHGRKEMEKCARCHPDHAGRDFAMISWEEGSAERFDHSRTGWPLEAKHAALKCAQCHNSRFQTSEAIRESPRKNPATGWIGLQRDCSSCHRKDDVHRGALGADCGKCHDVRAWKPAPRFDHARTDYPLTGKHAQVACEKCHLAASLKLEKDPQGKSIPIYKPLPHQECSVCHADPHAGKLGPSCARCHATSAWSATDQKAFDHDRTRYPLRGRHAAVKCEQCHDPRQAWGKKPPFASCTACHADVRAGHTDPHAGLATLRGKAVDCSACHDVQGWRPSTYTADQHRSSAYPLLGKHAAVKCAACHRKNPPGVPPARLGGSGVLIRMAYARCEDCHEQAHGRQLAKRPDRGRCETCHTVNAWIPSTFTVKDHARLRLPLEGKHAAILCAACHGPSRPGLRPLPGPETLGSARVAINLDEIDCIACHVDPHSGRFGPKGVRAKPSGCVACHDLKAFRPSTIDVAAHKGFAFPLEAAHRATPCDACHRESKSKAAASSLLLPARTLTPMPFEVKDQRCEGCHEDPHGGQFARRPDKGACGACHNESFFRPASRFDHTRNAGFALDGAHAKVACAACHPARRNAAGRSLVIYRPVPKECKACHAGRKS